MMQNESDWRNRTYHCGNCDCTRAIDDAGTAQKCSKCGHDETDLRASEAPAVEIHVDQALMNNINAGSPVTTATVRDALLSQSNAAQCAVILGRDRFVRDYCGSRRWDIEDLTVEQILEIRSQEGWKNPAVNDE
jgi:hypothetical protein